MSAGMIYVYKMPLRMSDGYCFGGGKPIRFTNVDWMNTPPSDLTRAGVEAFIRQKSYVQNAQPNDQFLVVCTDRPDCTFTFSAQPTKGGAA